MLHVARSALQYQSSKAIADAPICERMRAIAAQYPRYGYRFVRIFLEREGHRMSFTRAYRLWNAAGLQVPRKRLRRRVAAARPRPLPPTERKQVWAYDFRLRHLRQRTTAQVPDHHRRVDQGVPRHRGDENAATAFLPERGLVVTAQHVVADGEISV